MGVYSGNRTLLGESMEVNNTGHVLDFVIECERNELKLFEAVIGCDMIQAYTEAGLTTLTLNEAEDAEEKSERSLGKKIKDLFERAVAAIKRFVSTFIAKIQNFFSNDQKLIKEYIKNFTANGVGYKLSFDWRRPVYSIFDNPETIIKKTFYDIAEDGELNGLEYTREISAIKNCSSTDEIDKIVEKAKKEYKESSRNIYKLVEKESFQTEKVEEDVVLKQEDVSQIVKVMSASTRSINACKRYGNFMINELKSKQNDLKSAMKISENDLGLAKLNGMYKLGSMYIKLAQKGLSANLNAMTRALASCRKVFVAAGKNATEKKATTEAAALYDNLLAEASDIYVMQALDMSM